MNKINFVALFIVLFLSYFLLSIPYYSGDVKNHLVWAQSIINSGTMGFYAREFHDFAFPNYPPVAMILFTLSLLIYQLVLNLIYFLNNILPVFPSNLVHFFEWENVVIAFLKLPAMLSSLGTGWCIYTISREFFGYKVKGASILMIIFLLNPAQIYLSVIWGQVDLLPIFFLLLSLIFLGRKKVVTAAIFATIALLSKQTVIIFWLILFVYLIRTFSVRQVVNFLVVSIITFYISYLPFHTPSLTWAFELYKINFSMVAFSTSVNSLNFWGAISHYDGQSDTAVFYNLPLYMWGYLLFLAFFIPVFIIYLRKTTLKELYFVCYLAILLSFFLLTRMHERYLIPAIVFGALFALQGKKYLISYIFFSSLHFLNLYRGLYQPDLPLFTYLARSTTFLDFLVVTYSLFIVYNLYLYIGKRKDWQK